MDPFTEYIHTDTPWDDALAELLGASSTFPTLDNAGDAFPGISAFDDDHLDGGFTADQFASITGFPTFDFTHSDTSIPSPASVGSGGTGTTTTDGDSSVVHPSPGSSGGVRIKGEGSTEGEVGWGVVGEGWGVAPGLLGEFRELRDDKALGWIST